MNKNYKPSIKFYPQERNTTKMNLPNKLTLFRIILVPIMVIVSFFDIPGSFLGISTTMWIMELIFIIASITDKLDGYLARKNNQVTNFGKFLDPIADKHLGQTKNCYTNDCDNFNVLNNTTLFCICK